MTRTSTAHLLARQEHNLSRYGLGPWDGLGLIFKSMGQHEPDTIINGPERARHETRIGMLK